MKPDTIHRTLILMLCLHITGCAAIESSALNTNKPSLFINKSSEVATLLAYSQRIRSLPHDGLAAEYALANQALAKQRSDSLRLRLALLLTLPNAPFRDDSRGAALAEEVFNNKNGDNAELKALAQYIVTVANEQKRQEERYQLLAQKLKEEEKRAEALQQKVDALKSIEKDLINREKTKPLTVK